MLGISANRNKHCLEVARFMYEMAVQKGWSDERCKEMFLLGFVHDIGYEFCENQLDHPDVGADLLKSQGYKYWQEVKYHGMITDEYYSEELHMLNIADMSVNSCGKRVGAQMRLSDIKKRYGEDSEQYRRSVELARRLGLV